MSTVIKRPVSLVPDGDAADKKQPRDPGSQSQDLQMPSSAARIEPGWFAKLFNESLPLEGETRDLRGIPFTRQKGLLRQVTTHTASQAQTQEAFGFKWQKRETFESLSSLARMRQWLIERYGEVTREKWWGEYGSEGPTILDAGCGAAMSGIELFGDALKEARYIGADISEAVDVAAKRFAERGLPGAFLQCDLNSLPFASESLDIIFSEGVLHHTDSTERAFKRLALLLKAGGRFMFYVYRKKGPIREFTDDYIREKMQTMTPQQGWEAMQSLTKLGRALGDLNVEIGVPEAVELLDIPAGRVNLQRLFYWHVFKAFYRPEMTLDEMNHINYDWYAPANAHRHTIEQIRVWCADAGFVIERERVEEAGITIIARKVERR